MIKISVGGDPNIGLYGFCTEKNLISGLPAKEAKHVSKETHTKRITVPLLGTDLTGLFAAGNSSGIIISRVTEEFSRIPEHLNVMKIETTHTAVGNLILANDHGVIISPMLRKSAKEIGEFLNVKAVVSGIAGFGIVGSVALATNKGCVAHPKIKENEKRIVEEVLGVRVMEGTTNFGSPYVKAGIMANSHGFAVSPVSSGPEMGNVMEALGFLK